MKVRNIHIRSFPVPSRAIAPLIDGLSAPGDRLWPHERWPPMRFDRALGVGADGGHGPVRYAVERYEPGRVVRFRFKAPRGFVGTHAYLVHDDGQGSRLEHVLDIEAVGSARVMWPLVFRPLHDAAIEDSLDKAERYLTGSVRAPARWSALVRGLRAAFRLTRRVGLSA